MYLGVTEAMPVIILCLLIFLGIATLNRIFFGYWFNK